MSAVLRFDGVTVRAGETYDFADYSPLQATIMPVVSLQNETMQCWGTAVCVGAAGWFLTARHVVEDFVDKYGSVDDGTTGLFVLWETDERLGGANDYLGAPLPVSHLHSHSSADLVALSVEVNHEIADRLRVITLAARMPVVGEPLAVVGYSKMALEGRVRPGEAATLDYQRTLTVSVGDVLETQHERRPQALRGSPGVVTNAPILSGMSGGPVLDVRKEVIGFASSSMPPTNDDPSWNSYVALCGPALELDVRGRQYDELEIEAWTIAHLVGEGAIDCSMDDSVDVDEETGRLIYPATPLQRA